MIPSRKRSWTVMGSICHIYHSWAQALSCGHRPGRGDEPLPWHSLPPAVGIWQDTQTPCG